MATYLQSEKGIQPSEVWQLEPQEVIMFGGLQREYTSDTSATVNVQRIMNGCSRERLKNGN